MAKKRQVVQVNEERLRMMMAGDIPIKTEPDKDEVMPAERENTVDEKPTLIVSSQPVIEEMNQANPDFPYAKEFLRKPGGTCKRQTTIHLDESNYIQIHKILKTTEGISLANFINNVLSHHFSTYKEEIREIQKTFMESLFKNNNL